MPEQLPESASGASTGDARASPIGWYGKLPAAGDFLIRRLPLEFREPWDRWLSQGMLSASAQLGEQWESSFLSFPVWRFLWNTAQTAEPIWLGVLLPGVDRVGRLFPLTVAMPLARDIFSRLSCARLDAHLDQFQDLALRVLEDDNLEGFDAALCALPELALRVPITAGAQHDGEDLASWIESLGMARLVGGSANCVFWSRRSLIESTLRVDDCPPSTSSFVDLVRFVPDVEDLPA